MHTILREAASSALAGFHVGAPLSSIVMGSNELEPTITLFLISFLYPLDLWLYSGDCVFHPLCYILQACQENQTDGGALGRR